MNQKYKTITIVRGASKGMNFVPDPNGEEAEVRLQHTAPNDNQTTVMKMTKEDALYLAHVLRAAFGAEVDDHTH